MPISEKYAFENDQTKKCNLISTILCPRNLKGLKNFLPGAKYDKESNEKSHKKLGRVSSARSLAEKQVISPKSNEAK